MDIASLAIQLISGAVGGVGAGKVMPKFSLGTAGNAIAGLLGGGVGGQILSMVTGAAAAGGGGMDIGSILGGVASSGVGGGVLMVVIGLVKSAMKKT